MSMTTITPTPEREVAATRPAPDTPAGVTAPSVTLPRGTANVTEGITFICHGTWHPGSRGQGTLTVAASGRVVPVEMDLLGNFTVRVPTDGLVGAKIKLVATVTNPEFGTTATSSNFINVLAPSTAKLAPSQLEPTWL